MGINLKLLSVFVLVADHRSFRRAAEELGRSQSAVSTQIRQLEDQLGVPLFHRTTRHVSLSPEGEQLLEFAHEALNQVQNGVDAIVNAAEHRQRIVSIACASTIASARVAAMIGAFKAEFPHVNVYLRELSTTEELLECVQAETVDFAIGPRVKRETAFKFESMFDDELCAIVPVALAANFDSRITLEQASQLPMLSLSQSGVGIPPHVDQSATDPRANLESRFEGLQVSTLVSLVEAGLGAAIVSRASLPAGTERRVRVLSIKPAALRDICIITLPGKTFSPLAAELAAIAARVFRIATRAAESKVIATPRTCERAAMPLGRSAAQNLWSDLTAAARKEGRISILATIGSGFRTWAAAAQEAFPGIDIELHQLANSEEAADRMLAERQAGVYKYDLAILSAITALPRLKSVRAFDPLRPLIFRPDVLDDRAWKGGFDLWVDEERSFGFPLCDTVTRLAVNTDLVGEDELMDTTSLLDPRWRGKIVLADLRSGAEREMLTSIRLREGDEAVRRLLIDQEPTFVQDMRKAAVGLVRGTYAIAHGLGPQTLREFIGPEMRGRVKFVDIPNVTHVGDTFTLWLVNRSPNTSAARLFANWLLTKHGQQLLSTHLMQNVRRADVPLVDPTAVVRPGQFYFKSNDKRGFAEVRKTRTLLKQLPTWRSESAMARALSHRPRSAPGSD